MALNAPLPIRVPLRPLLLACGSALAIGFVASRTHAQAYGTPLFCLFFSDPLHMKAWLTTAATLPGVGQPLTAALMYGKLRFPPAGNLYSVMHR
jgi:Family of unknown function (DUF6529)